MYVGPYSARGSLYFPIDIAPILVFVGAFAPHSITCYFDKLLTYLHRCLLIFIHFLKF